MATIKGTKANDIRTGTSGKDTINGLQGNDTLSGMDGADAINGNEGNDTLTGGLGADVLTGGTGADIFKYISFDDSRAGSGFGIDTIRDFNAAVDVGDLTALGTATLKSSYDASFTGLQAVFAYNATTNQTTLSYYEGSSTVVFQVKFTGNVAYSETAFLGIVEVTPPPTTPALSIDDVIVNEADGTITFTVTRTGDLSGASSVSYNTSDDSAFDSSDYTAASGTVNFASGEATQTIIVSITDDNDIEDPETFKVTLSNPTGATISDSEGVGTINSDDVAPPPGPTEGADNLTGTAGVDTVDLLGGSDTYNGLGGNDIITGGAGNDALNGGDGSDKAIYTGNVSSYTIVDNGGTFTITDNRSGNPDGVDTLTNVEFAEFANGTLELGTDEFAPSGSILGTSGNDTINGTSGNDVIFGFSGNDTINASTGNDIVVGGDGHDILLGSDDLDTLEGGNGLDTILGGGGDDFIEGNAGADTLTGDGSGVQGGDLFVYRAITDSPFAGTTGSSLSYDQITDFQHDMPFEFISLSRIDPDGNPINGDQAFNFVNGPPSNASVGNVQIIPIDATHFSVVVYMPGDLTPDMVINVTSPGGLDQTDLIL